MYYRIHICILANAPFRKRANVLCCLCHCPCSMGNVGLLRHIGGKVPCLVFVLLIVLFSYMFLDNFCS